MRDYVAIGPAPAEEPCAQIGEEDFEPRALDECRRFIEVIRLKLGPEPEGAKLRVKWNDHDFGRYPEVACFYDDENEAAARYAYDCEGNAPDTWGDTTPLPKTRCADCDRRGPVDQGSLCGACAVTDVEAVR